MAALSRRILEGPEDAGDTVVVAIFGIGALLLLRFEFLALGLEGVGDVLEEDQSEDDVLVLSRVYVVAQGSGVNRSNRNRYAAGAAD